MFFILIIFLLVCPSFAMAQSPIDSSFKIKTRDNISFISSDRHTLYIQDYSGKIIKTIDLDNYGKNPVSIKVENGFITVILSEGKSRKKSSKLYFTLNGELRLQVEEDNMLMP